MGPPKLASAERFLLREYDLDATVLRLAYAWRRWNAQVVHATARNHHVAARDAEAFECCGDGVGTPLRQPLGVASRSRSIGIARDLKRDTTTPTVLVRST